MTRNGSFDGDELEFSLDDEAQDQGKSPYGTTFPLPDPLASVLMAWAVDQSPDPAAASEDLAEVDRTLLVVEDDRASRIALCRLLKARGWKVKEAATLAEGLASLEPPPRCLVLDLMLPDGDGVEILRLIRADSLPIRVVVATGVSDDARLDAVVELRPDCLIRKPIDFETLLQACGP